MTHLPQQISRAIRGERTELPDQRLQVAPDEQLHHVIERAVGGYAEVEEINCVWRVEDRRRLRLTLEPAQQASRGLLARKTQHRWAHELDRCRSGEQSVLGTPDLTHSPLTELLYQLVVAELACSAASAINAINMTRESNSGRTWFMSHTRLRFAVPSGQTPCHRRSSPGSAWRRSKESNMSEEITNISRRVGNSQDGIGGRRHVVDVDQRAHPRGIDSGAHLRIQHNHSPASSE